MCGILVLAGAVLATYTAVTKSQKEMSDLTKQNLEALVQSTREGNKFTKECINLEENHIVCNENISKFNNLTCRLFFCWRRGLLLQQQKKASDCRAESL